LPPGPPHTATKLNAERAQRVTAPTASSPRRSRIVGQAEVPPAELVPNPRNWRTHPADQQQALSGALAEVGWVAEVTVNRTTGHVCRWTSADRARTVSARADGPGDLPGPRIATFREPGQRGRPPSTGKAGWLRGWC